MFVAGFFTIALLSVLAMVSRNPFIFPPLGASAFLHFHAPSSPTASPRNTMYGHALAIFSGYFALAIASPVSANRR